MSDIQGNSRLQEWEVRSLVDCMAGLWSHNQQRYELGWNNVMQIQTQRILGGLTAAFNMLVMRSAERGELPEDPAVAIDNLTQIAMMVPQDLGLAPDELMEVIDQSLSIDQEPVVEQILLDPVAFFARIVGAYAAFIAWEAKLEGTPKEQLAERHLAATALPAFVA